MTESSMYFGVITKRTFNKATNKQAYPNEAFIISPKQAEQLRNSSSVSVLSSDEFIRPFNYETDAGCKNIMIICGGGIGDILAHSSMCEYLSDANIYFVTKRAYFDVLRWFNKNVIAIDIDGAILHDFSFRNQMTKYSGWRRIKTEFAVAVDNTKDWFVVLYSKIGVKQMDTKYFRPHVKVDRISDKPSNINCDNALLICNKSSCMMRNIEFNEIYSCLSDNIKSKYKLYAYSDSLSEIDKSRAYPDVTFIKSNSVGDFFLDLYDAKMVITVDSAAIHFREGIGKGAIGLYNSFDKNIRASFYKYTHSFNINSECEKQPCFKHELRKGDLCPMIKKWQYSAPCFISDSNKYLSEQLIYIFDNYL